MRMVDKHLDFVNKQVTFQEAQAAKYATNSYRRDLHKATASQLKDLIADFTALEAKYEALTSAANSQNESNSLPAIPSMAEIALKPSDLEGLPPEVVSELSVSGADPTDFNILNVINDAGGILSLDRILIGLFRTYDERIKRATLTSRLNRMIPKGLLFPVPNRKGLYSTAPLTREANQESLETV